MAKRKGKGKIHPQFLQHVLHREDPPSETPPPGSDHVEKLSFLRENTCTDLVVSDCSQPLPLSVILPLTTTTISICETPVKTSKLPVEKKREKRIGYNPGMKKKIETLGEHLNPIPFSPKKFLDLAAHKCLLTNLGLWDFLNINFGLVIRPGLIEQFVANYNPKRKQERASFVDGYAIHVSLSKMASALRFPTKNIARKRKYPAQDDVLESGVLVFSEDDALFVEELVWSYMVLQDAGCEVPDEVMKIVSDVRDRKLEEVDWAGLIWFMMERELLKHTALRNCYYASHMQLLVECQEPWLFDSGFQDARFLEMGSAVGGEGYVKDNQLQLLDGNEIGNREIVLVNGMFMDNSFGDSVETEAGMQIEAVKRMDSAQLRCCTLKKSPSLELSLVTAEVSQEEILVEVETGDRLERLMTRLFDEAENEESKELVNEEVCDAKVGLVLDTLEEEDASMDMQIDSSSWCLVDGNDNLSSLETSWQQIGLAVKQAKGSTEVLSEVLVEENNNIITSEQVCISHNDEVIDLKHEAVATMDETWAKSENQEAGFLLGQEGIQEVVGKSVSPKGAQENVQENACFCAETGGQFLASAPLDSPLDSAGAVDAIVLESDGEGEERERQLNCIDGSQGYVLQQLSLHVEEDNIEAQSRKGHLEDLRVHGVQSISSQVEDHILPHHAAYHSSVNSVLHGLGMHMGTVPQLYQANAYNNVSLVQKSRPESEINPSLPGSSFNGSPNRQVNYISNAQCGNVDATINTTRNNPLNEPSMNLDLRSEKVQIWLSNLKSAANIQCQSVANEDLRKKLAQQIHITQQYKILRHREQEKHKREISMYARQLHLMDSLLADYKKIIKETDKSCSKHAIHCQQPVESKYMDHPDGKGRVITVAEWEKLVQERQNQSDCNVIQSMIERFQHGLIVELEEHLCKLDGFCTRLSGCADSLDILKAKTSRS